MYSGIVHAKSEHLQKQPNDCDSFENDANQLEAKAKANDLENMYESSASSAKVAIQTLIQIIIPNTTQIT